MRGGRVSASILAVFALEAFVFASVFPRLPEIKAALGLSEGELGLLLLAPPLGAVTVTPAVGVLSARLSPAALNAAAMTWLAAAIAILGLAGSPWPLAAALVAVGCGLGAMGVAMNTAGIAVEAALGRPILSRCHVCFSVGVAAGGLFGGAMAGAGVPIAAQFSGTAVVVLAAVLAAASGLPRTPPPKEDGRGVPWPSRAVALPAAIIFCSLMLEGAVIDWSAVFLATVLSADGAAVGLGLTAFASAMATVRFAGDRLGKRFGPRSLLTVSGVTALVGLAAVAAAPSQWAAITGFAIAGAGVAVVVPTVLRVAAERTPGAPGVGVAAASTVGYLGFLLGPPIIGGIAEAASLRWSFAALAGAMLVATALSTRLAPAPQPKAA